MHKPSVCLAFSTVFALGLTFAVPGCRGSRAPARVLPTPTTPSKILGTSESGPAVVRIAAPRLRTDTRPLPADLAQYRRVSEVRISPDGRQIAYLVRTPSFDPQASLDDDDDEAGGWQVETQLFVVERESGAARQLTFSEGAPTRPRWSPDSSRLAFLRDRDDEPTLQVLDMRGGEARPIDTGELSPVTYSWSPDGQWFAFTSQPALAESERRARWQRGGATRFDGDWGAAGLYVVASGPGASASPRRVDRGEVHIVDFDWSPDGQQFAVRTAASADPYHTWGLHRIAVISAKDGALVTQLEDQPADTGRPRWSRDGRRVAYARGHETLSLRNQLIVRDLATGARWNAASKLDPTLAGFVWAADSRSLLTHVQVATRSVLYRLSADGKRADPVHESPYAIAEDTLTTDRSGRHVAMIGSNRTTPRAPLLLDTKRASTRVLIDVNPQVAQWTLAKTERVQWKNGEGVTVEGVLYITPHARQGVAPPLLVLPHGGPDAVTVERFGLWAHFFAARGYSVFRPNYRGGFGYGHAFYAANRARLGEIEFADIESGVDHLIATGKADPQRLFYGGWSWGGYITTWTITRSQRYKAAVVGAGVVDVVAQYVTSDINHGRTADWEFRGRPWRGQANFDRANPARQLHDIRTPTLILHGRSDDRVDFVNGMTLYRALHDIGVEVAFWAYPREPHVFREPAHVVHMLEAWAHWYDSHQ